MATLTRTRFLTADEKAHELALFADYQADPANWRGDRAGGRGFIDPEVLPLVDALNALDGVCTLQSCCGHAARGVHDPGDLWVRLSEPMTRRFDERVGELLAQPVIRSVARLYHFKGNWEMRSEPREPYDVFEITFHGCEAGTMGEAERVIAGFFERCAQ